VHQLDIKVLNIVDARCNHEIQKPNFTKIRPVAAELFHAQEETDERTDT